MNSSTDPSIDQITEHIVALRLEVTAVSAKGERLRAAVEEKCRAISRLEALLALRSERDPGRIAHECTNTNNSNAGR